MKRTRVRSSSSQTKEEEKHKISMKREATFVISGPRSLAGKDILCTGELAAASVLIPSIKMRGHLLRFLGEDTFNGRRKGKIRVS
ncbi:hypothetical protein CEXT_698211 [Caerostris extrusa]|uniref:Uncharacterized protein n=1 Tax=Caerostris extrusa TaxID=172846 RepID=A0AAV4S2G0_CAEEX|nr:hypothetical protein CEXT_698211 [Caerostris extrusa]